MKHGHWDCHTTRDCIPCLYSNRHGDRRCEGCFRQIGEYTLRTRPDGIDDMKRVQETWARRWGR